MLELDEERRPDFLQLERNINRPPSSPPSPPPRPPTPPQKPVYVPPYIPAPNPIPAPQPKPQTAPYSLGAKTMTADNEDRVANGLNGVPRDLISLRATPD